jgi:hypothetical protein
MSQRVGIAGAVGDCDHEVHEDFVGRDDGLAHLAALVDRL